MTSESEIQAKAMLAIGSLPGVKISRNSIGVARDRSGNTIRFGLFGAGGADIIGFKSVIVTPEMVGEKLAIFLAVEVKNESGRVRPEQKRFLDVVSDAGGIAGIVRSPEDALALVGVVDAV